MDLGLLGAIASHQAGSWALGSAVRLSGGVCHPGGRRCPPAHGAVGWEDAASGGWLGGVWGPGTEP